MSYASRRPGIWLVLAVAVGCGGRGEDQGEVRSEPAQTAAEPAATETAGEEPGYVAIEVTDAGTIRGHVRFEGPPPPPDTVAVTDDREVCGEFREVHPVRVGANGGLVDAVVSLVDIRRGAPLEEPASPPELDQRGCRFSPHVLLARAGSPVRILNSDPIMHNVHTLSFENRPINRSQPAGVRQIEVVFPRPEKVKARCDVHGWMSAWIVVIDQPYHAVTGPDGSFVIENVPPGSYTLEIWHEALGARTETLTVAPGGIAQIDVVMTGTQS